MNESRKANTWATNSPNKYYSRDGVKSPPKSQIWFIRRATIIFVTDQSIMTAATAVGLCFSCNVSNYVVRYLHRLLTQLYITVH